MKTGSAGCVDFLPFSEKKSRFLIQFPELFVVRKNTEVLLCTGKGARTSGNLFSEVKKVRKE